MVEPIARLLEEFSLLEKATILMTGKQKMKEKLIEIQSAVSGMQDGIDELRMVLNETRQQNEECRALSSLLSSLDQRLLHMDSNLPNHMVQSYMYSANKVKPENVHHGNIYAGGKNTPMQLKDCKKVLFEEEVEQVPQLLLISTAEYTDIPKYILGRQTIDTLNALIGTINQIVKRKYLLLTGTKEHARKQGKLDLYLQFKKQQLDIPDEKGYLYFFTGEDYERQTKTKLNKIKLNLLTILRHCKRIREYRVKNDIRYVVITEKMY